MKKVVVVGVLLLVLCGTAEASVLDWPVIGQVSRVAVCVVGGSGTLVKSLLVHLGSWGAEVLTRVADCSKAVVSNTQELVTGAVTLTVPTPAVQPTEDAHVETPH